jgi:hypothetical protein
VATERTMARTALEIVTVSEVEEAAQTLARVVSALGHLSHFERHRHPAVVLIAAHIANLTDLGVANEKRHYRAVNACIALADARPEGDHNE